MQPTYHAFTSISQGGILRELITNIGVTLPYVPEAYKDKQIKIYETKALWDTGATNSVITKQTAIDLQLKPVSIVNVQHAGGISQQNAYIVNIFLPNNIIIPNVKVTECADTNGKFGVIIGMDIICIGDFAITNEGGKTMFSLMLPSYKAIDFVAQANELNKPQPIVAQPVLGRNDMCHCGSGKKFKHCHGA